MRGAGHIQLFARTSTSPVQWRLLSGNNREFGRGVEEFPDAETCRIAVKELQQDAANLEPRICRVRSSRWAWELLDEGRVVVFGRSVDRLIRCEQALAQAPLQLATAVIGTGVMFSGARRWGSVAS
jgi:hypothetical protein